MSEPRTFDGDTLLAYVREVAAELPTDGTRRRLVVVGGALLAWWGLRESTRDVDSAAPLDEISVQAGVQAPPGDAPDRGTGESLADVAPSYRPTMDADRPRRTGASARTVALRSSAGALALTLVLAGCGGDDDSAVGGGAADPTAQRDSGGADGVDRADGAGASVPAPDRATPGEVVALTSAQAAALRSELPEMLFIDVRSQDEYIASHMVGAQNINIEDERLWQRRTAPLDTDRPTAVYCRTGSRSAEAAQRLVEQGFTEVYDVGGITDWGEGDLPVDR